jgi:hypothetical protein
MAGWLTPNERFDKLLKAMASGEPPKGHKESEGPALARNRAEKEDKRASK